MNNNSKSGTPETMQSHLSKLQWDTWNYVEPLQWAAVEHMGQCKGTQVSDSGTPTMMQSQNSELNIILRVTQIYLK